MGVKMISFFHKTEDSRAPHFLLPVKAQVKAWRKANRKMRWGIADAEFAAIGKPPALTAQDRADGFTGVVLSYGFGDDGYGYADAVRSGQEAWRYAQSRFMRKTWQCQYLDFDKSDHFRLRPEAPPRPKGFYFAKFKPGDRLLHTTVARFRKTLGREDTGCGPEGIQLIAISHYPSVANLMNRRKIALMAFADYDVAPYGFNDFYDALQMFCSSGVLGLGIGNVDHDYPLFGIPILRFP